MKNIISFILCLIPVLTFGQYTTSNPDTVCFPVLGTSTYLVTNNANYTYTWSVANPGSIISGQGTNQIIVDWSNANPGLINNAISVFSTQNNCQSQPVNMNVLIYQVSTSITSIGPFCSSEPCVNLIGNPVGGLFSGSGVQNGQFCPNSANTGINQVTYTYQSGGCTFVTNIDVTINPSPVLSPIQHD